MGGSGESNMSVKLINYLIKAREFILSKDVIIELLKIIFTALIGFITFKIYQLYSNKKDNSKLYIQMIKLEREIINNIQLIELIINDYSRYQLLDYLFKGENSEGLYDLLELVYSLNQYVYEEKTYEYGDIVDVNYVYVEHQYDSIQNLNYERHQVEEEGEEYPGHINSIDTEIKRLEGESIFNLLKEIENKAGAIDIDGHKMSNSIKYLHDKVSKYNTEKLSHKKKMLDEFCSQLIDQSNIFAETLSAFKDYKNISRKVHKKVSNKIEFKVWQSQDMDLLGVYSSEDYLILEEFYHKYDIIDIGIWEIERAEELHKLIQDIYEDRIKKINNMLKKTLNKTNRLFGKI